MDRFGRPQVARRPCPFLRGSIRIRGIYEAYGDNGVRREFHGGIGRGKTDLRLDGQRLDGQRLSG